ncbi:acetyl-CoA hydrolase/transferase C-terminal domain-containing protein [[Mycobacterium] zoologicum]|uniref:acetyl-CoA hydrolase/transferase C-terminal domain-containing protein n=1 Tax=[Mycobacterium] zoologicum TaxID=2872311 RepID=UPI002CEE691F|nr:acetyl-CoA hydrolase/transferase C-terminal domain-containing protein [Mycolicibacter sp. MYC101]MEB3065117.1 acetyl-CoA hydrolase/transferase C-terminal domain-containing protein [Mycolicibacter sp. MYC101]
MTVALGDGVGAVRCLDDGTSVAAALSALARRVGSLRLVLGWLPAPLDGLDPDAFTEVVALMPGWGVRAVLQSPSARYLPTSLAGIAASLTGTLRPDVLITKLVEREGLLQFGTEVSWQRQLVEAGVPVLGIVDTTAPAASAEAPLDPSRVRVIARSVDGPVRVPGKEPHDIHNALADAVLRFVPEGARLQYGPGQLGTALLRRAQMPLRIDTGLLTDAVVDLDNRGLLVGMPSATYLLGSEVLYEWADGRPILRGIDHSHDTTRLSRGAPFVAVNTALEIDPVGQVNVEGIGQKVVGGIGGHPDYCAAARMSCGGLSIIAVPTTVNGRSPLVTQLSRPASTPAHDIDLIVTESGYADLRGADWSQRRKLITELFD